MIQVHRLHGEQLFINAAHIVAVEPTPDTLLHLHDGSRLMVRESAQDVCAAVTRWFQDVGHVTVLPFDRPPVGAHPSDEDT